MFFREGFLHFTTDALADRLRCSKRTLYQIAGSREALFELVIERWLAGVRRAGDGAAERESDPFRAVTAYLHVAVDATREAGSQFVRDLARFPAGHRRLMRHQRLRIQGLERLIERARRTGAFRGIHPKLVADVMLAAVARLVDPDVLATVGLSLSAAFEELYDVFEYGLIGHRSGRGKLKG